MNNYGRNQMNNRSRQGNMQYRNQMNRNNCGCVEARTGNDNCGCKDARNDNRRTSDNCGCNEARNDNRRTNDNCGCNDARNDNRRTNETCGCNDARRTADSCDCDHHDHSHDHGTAGCNASRYDQLSGMALAMSYVPWQTFRQMYEVEDALCHGTIFKELELVFMRGCRS